MMQRGEGAVPAAPAPAELERLSQARRRCRYLFVIPRPLDINLIARLARLNQARATGRCPKGPNARHGAGRFLGSSRGAPLTSCPASNSSPLGARCARTLTHAHTLCLEVIRSQRSENVVTENREAF